MKKHPNKHIQAAIEYALLCGWQFRPSNGHAFGRLICGARTQRASDERLVHAARA